ncbi:MAG: hypothetical protein L0287_15605 [Anaerolineae bacterium]|nr:hypothetical protein [Anaerolineae bacterium]
MKYSGYDCCALENDTLQLLVTRSVGPRIISFGFKNGDNLFAVLPDFVTELPNGEVFHFYGGHRLWQVPEDLNTTYTPDLETLGPITSIAQNATASHIETWDLYKDIECPRNENEAQSLVDKLGMN